MNLGESNELGDVEDRRGSRTGLAVGGGVGALILGLVAAYFGIDPNVAQQLVQRPGAGPNTNAPHDGYVDFSRKLLGNINAVWKQQFLKEYGRATSRLIWCCSPIASTAGDAA